MFTTANRQHGTTPFFADRLKQAPLPIKAFSKTPAWITYPPIVVDEPGSKPQAFVPYVDGDLDRLLSEGEPGYFLFSGRQPHAQKAKEPRAVDMKQLEAMRALGYMGDE